LGKFSLRNLHSFCQSIFISLTSLPPFVSSVVAQLDRKNIMANENKNLAPQKIDDNQATFSSMYLIICPIANVSSGAKSWQINH
jgi:hypothetical protein